MQQLTILGKNSSSTLSCKYNLALELLTGHWLASLNYASLYLQYSVMKAIKVLSIHVVTANLDKYLYTSPGLMEV